MKLQIICDDLRMEALATYLEVKHQVTRNKIIDINWIGDALIMGMNGNEQIDLIKKLQAKQKIIIFSGNKLDNIDSIIYSEIDSYKAINSKLSAYGILHELIHYSKKGINELKIGVVGYGSCGKAIVEILKQLQIKVDIIRHQKQLGYIYSKEYDMNCDCLIYSATGMVFDDHQCYKLKDILVLDIVNKGFFNKYQLNDYHECKKLPAYYGYETSAKAIEKIIEEQLNEN